MRPPFAYETNAELIRRILVPDPIRAKDWQAFIQARDNAPATPSILQEIVSQGLISPPRLLDALETATGARSVPFPLREPTGTKPPMAQLLEKQGFIYLGEQGNKHLVGGGAFLPPDLRQFTGQSRKKWEWVLVEPTGCSRATESGSPKAPPPPGKTTGLNEWLEEFIGSLCATGARDIHFERENETLTVRYHSRGKMQQAGIWQGRQACSILRLLKVWAGMSTGPHNPPMDGRILIGEGAQSMALRISHLTTVNGESAVLRVQAMHHDIPSLLELGAPADLAHLLLDTALHDPGLILCSGPTGSGKTTTVYGLLQELEGRGLKILSIEDPVERNLAHVVQSSVDTVNGWTFDSAIKAFLRQDPDVIFIGEIRDSDSARAASRAALSGHCVLATLHAHTAEAALQRLLVWGVGNGILEETIRCTVNQRLTEAPDRNRLTASFSWTSAGNNPAETSSKTHPFEQKSPAGQSREAF